MGQFSLFIAIHFHLFKGIIKLFKTTYSKMTF